MKKEIYLDYAAASPIDPRAQKEVIRGMKIVGNPSSYNNAGRQAAEELFQARLKVARFIGATPQEIHFTASGSEANNMAVFGLAETYQEKNQFIVNPTEHLSVLEPIKALGQYGRKILNLKVNDIGIIDLEDLKSKLSKDTLLVSVMYANNEIGTIQPILKIAQILKEFRKENNTELPFLHVDTCQAIGFFDIQVKQMGIDLLTFNGSKIYGPRGVGVLYAREGVNVSKWILGGSQEGGLRAGTENLPAILGLAKAISSISRKDSEDISKLRDYFIERLKVVLPDIKINGPEKGELRLPNNINFSVPNLDSENLLLELDKYGIRAGSGSACTARSVEPSHVIRAIGVQAPYLDGVIRFSLGRDTKKGDLDYVLKSLPTIVKNLKSRYSIEG
jgi:cysteine desulfurase